LLQLRGKSDGNLLTFLKVIGSKNFWLSFLWTLYFNVSCKSSDRNQAVNAAEVSHNTAVFLLVDYDLSDQKKLLLPPEHLRQ